MRRTFAVAVLLALTAYTPVQSTTSAPPGRPEVLAGHGSSLTAVYRTTVATTPAGSVRAVRYPKIPPRPAAIPRSSERYREYAFARIHYSRTQMRCLDHLWIGESNWRVRSGSPGGSYGIPQADPGSKMRSAGADWLTSGRTQVRWGLGYIRALYGTPCGAWGIWQGHHPHWY